MIITLIGADFSSANVGTLTTWRVTTSLGKGATYNGPTSVERDPVQSLSATVTIDEGYTVNIDNVSVLMGNVAQTGAASISGNTITITLAAVTGNVTIKVPTVNSSTGEEDDGDDSTTTPDTPSESTVFDFDFVNYTLADYASQGIFTIPDTSTVDTIEYSTTYGANLNNNLPYGLTLVNPIDASRAWTLEFTAYFATPTNLNGNRRAFLTGGDDLTPFCVINATTLENLGFQISSGSHKYVGGGQLTYDAEASYKIVHDGSTNITAYKNDASIGTTTVDFTGKTFGTILGVIKGKSSAYVWQDVEDGKKSYLHKMKFYYN